MLWDETTKQKDLPKVYTKLVRCSVQKPATNTRAQVELLCYDYKER